MCSAITARRNLWLQNRGTCGQVQDSEGFSHDSENDLALMVRDFVENGGGYGGSNSPDSWCSSDSDSALPDLRVLADKISRYKRSLTHYENELCSTVNSLLISMKASNIPCANSGHCGTSCVMFSLAKLLRDCGYDAAVCVARWQGSSKFSHGNHEYIDVINIGETATERVIIDVDFRSHFEIARAVHAYDRILKSLPVLYVGSLTRLKQYLQVMAEAARSSLKQNSMPLPPWRSLSYLQAKWNSPFQRQSASLDQSNRIPISSDHKQCSGFLKRLQFSLHDAREEKRCFKPVDCGNNRTSKFHTLRHNYYIDR